MILMNLFAGIENGLVVTAGEGDGAQIGRLGLTYIHYIHIYMCKIDSYWEPAVEHREPSLVLCDDLHGWDGVEGMGGKYMGGGRRCMLIVYSHCHTAGTNTSW